MECNKEKTKKDIQTRLRRIEGQVKGIEKMVAKDCCCREILIQIAAIRAAINKVGALVLQNYATNCLVEENDGDITLESIEKLISTLTMFIK